MTMTAPDARDRTLPPIEVRDLEHAKQFTFYRNGDEYFSGCSFRWNKRRCRTFDAFLSSLTDSIKPRNGAIRRVYTPNHGSRIKDLSELEEGGVYVAAPQEAFKKLKNIKYTDIQKTPRRSRPRRNYLVDIPPKNKKYVDVQGKIQQTNSQALRIYVWLNNESIKKPDHIVLHPHTLRSMHDVHDAIDDVMKGRCFDPITKLYTKEGELVRDVRDLKSNQFYVAIPIRQQFRSVYYREKQLSNFMTSPHLDRSFQLPPLGSPNSKNGKQWSPDTSGSYPNSERNYSQRYKKTRSNRNSREDDMPPRRPIAHKRSSDRKTREEIDYDKDDGGVFRSKQSNRYTQGAREVRDTRDTRVDLPIDQVQAEEVKEEEVSHAQPQDDNTAPVPSGVELTKLPSEQTSDNTKEDSEEERIRGKPNRNNNQAPSKSKGTPDKTTDLTGKNGYNRRSPDALSNRKDEESGRDSNRGQK